MSSSSPDGTEGPPAAPPARSTGPRLPTRILMPLAPKPPPPPPPPPPPEPAVEQRSASASAASSVVGRASSPLCPVPFCRRKGCLLASHKAWVKGTPPPDPPGEATAPAQGRPSIITNDPVYTNSYAYRFIRNFVDPDIAAGRVDPFYQLPVPDTTHPQLQRLFHDFFTVQLNRAMTFPRPSCFTSDPIGALLAAPAMVDSAVCLSIIALSATRAGMRVGQPARNASAQSIYGKAERLLRQRLANQSMTDETIIAANTLSLASIPFENEALLTQNRTRVRDLIHRRGGPAHLGGAGVLAEYVMWTEVLAATWLNDEPYVVSEGIRGFLTAPPAAVYGAAFHFPHVLEGLEPGLTEIALATCRMTEVLEQAIREKATPQEYIYFYSSYKWTCIRRAQLRASCYNSNTKDECLVNVMEIFRINAFSTQPENEHFLRVSCAHLQRALLQTNMSSYWDQQLQLLIWALFVVGTIEIKVDSRPWFMDLLHRSISHSYTNQIWPSTWRDEALQNAKSFAWSEVRFATSFSTTCDQVEQWAVQPVGPGMPSMFVT